MNDLMKKQWQFDLEGKEEVERMQEDIVRLKGMLEQKEVKYN